MDRESLVYEARLAEQVQIEISRHPNPTGRVPFAFAEEAAAGAGPCRLDVACRRKKAGDVETQPR